MRIWIVNHYAIPPSQSGGTRHYSLAKHLQARGHKVLIVAASFGLQSATGRTMSGEAEHANHDGVPFLYLNVPPYAGNSIGRIRNMLSFARAVGKLPLHAEGRPDVILGSSPHLFAADAAMRLARRLGSRFVLEVRDVWPQSLIDIAGVSPGHPFVRWLAVLERKLYRGADAIVSLLPGVGKHVATFGVPEHRVTWVPNGFELTLLPEPTAPPLGEKFTMAYAGSMGVANAMDSVIEAARIIEERSPGKISFELYGAGTERARLEAMAPQNVHFRGTVPKVAMLQELSRANAFIAVARKTELYRFGLSFNKLFDYMAACRPTLFSVDLEENPIQEANAGIIVPAEDSQAIADAAIRLSSMPREDLVAMGERGRALVEEKYSMERLAAILEQVLKA